MKEKIKKLFKKIKKPLMITFYIFGVLLVDGALKTFFPTLSIALEPIWLTNCMAMGIIYFK